MMMEDDLWVGLRVDDLPDDGPVIASVRFDADGHARGAVMDGGHDPDWYRLVGDGLLSARDRILRESPGSGMPAELPGRARLVPLDCRDGRLSGARGCTIVLHITDGNVRTISPIPLSEYPDHAAGVALMLHALAVVLAATADTTMGGDGGADDVGWMLIRRAERFDGEWNHLFAVVRDGRCEVNPNVACAPWRELAGFARTMHAAVEGMERAFPVPLNGDVADLPVVEFRWAGAIDRADADTLYAMRVEDSRDGAWRFVEGAGLSDDGLRRAALASLRVVTARLVSLAGQAHARGTGGRWA